MNLHTFLRYRHQIEKKQIRREDDDPNARMQVGVDEGYRNGTGLTRYICNKIESVTQLHQSDDLCQMFMNFYVNG